MCSSLISATILFGVGVNFVKMVICKVVIQAFNIIAVKCCGTVDCKNVICVEALVALAAQLVL